MKAPLPRCYSAARSADSSGRRYSGRHQTTCCWDWRSDLRVTRRQWWSRSRGGLSKPWVQTVGGGRHHYPCTPADWGRNTAPMTRSCSFGQGSPQNTWPSTWKVTDTRRYQCVWPRAPVTHDYRSSPRSTSLPVATSFPLPNNHPNSTSATLYSARPAEPGWRSVRVVLA